MSDITPSQQAGFTLAAIGIIGGLIYGLIPSSKDGMITPYDGGTPCATHVSVPWPGAVPSDVVCKRSEVVGPSTTWTALGLCSDGHYASIVICASPVADAGTTSLPPGLRVLEVEQLVPYVAGMPQLEVWDQRNPAAQFLCACSTGSDGCQWCRPQMGGPCVWQQAPSAMNMLPGTFAGPCTTTPCFATPEGGDPMPAVCRPAGPDAGAPPAPDAGSTIPPPLPGFPPLPPPPDASAP